MSRGGSRPLTLRAMLAADCSRLPMRLRHLVHVLALHADNTTGIGLTGQERLARYLGCTGRHVRNLLSELEALWEAGESPVGILREKRWLNSDRYRVVVREGAQLELPKLYDERNPSSGHDRNHSSGMIGTPVPVNRNPSSAQPPTGPEPQFLQSTEVALQSNPQSKNIQSFSGRAEGPAERKAAEAAAPRSRAERLAAVEAQRKAALAARRT